MAKRILTRTLDATQKAVAEEIAFKRLTGKSEAEIAKEYNVDRSTIWRWKSLQAFNDEVNKLVKEFQRSNLVDVNGILIDLLTNGSNKDKLKAIELFYRNQGLFKDVVEVSEKSYKDVNIDDLMAEIKEME